MVKSNFKYVSNQKEIRDYLTIKALVSCFKTNEINKLFNEYKTELKTDLKNDFDFNDNSSKFKLLNLLNIQPFLHSVQYEYNAKFC